jgi:hypothetical protein
VPLRLSLISRRDPAETKKLAKGSGWFEQRSAPVRHLRNCGHLRQLAAIPDPTSSFGRLAAKSRSSQNDPNGDLEHP